MFTSCLDSEHLHIQPCHRFMSIVELPCLMEIGKWSTDVKQVGENELKIRFQDEEKYESLFKTLGILWAKGIELEILEVRRKKGH